MAKKESAKGKTELLQNLVRRHDQIERVVKNQEGMAQEYKNHSDKELRRPENKQDYVNGGYLTTLRKQKYDRSMTREEYEAHAERKGYYKDLAESKATPYADRKSKGLEATTATASILGLAGGAFFLSANMTGNVIADYSTETTSLVGVLLFVIAVIAGVLWLSLRKENAKVVVKSKKVSKKKRK